MRYDDVHLVDVDRVVQAQISEQLEVTLGHVDVSPGPCGGCCNASTSNLQPPTTSKWFLFRYCCNASRGSCESTMLSRAMMAQTNYSKLFDAYVCVAIASSIARASQASSRRQGSSARKRALHTTFLRNVCRRAGTPTYLQLQRIGI